jgi:hypothetical protein
MLVVKSQSNEQHLYSCSVPYTTVALEIQLLAL